MKRCSKCGLEVTDDCNFCPNCGGKCIFDSQNGDTVVENTAPELSENAQNADETAAEPVEQKVNLCPRCSKNVDGSFTFCPHCGANLSISDSSAPTGIKNIADSVKVEVKRAEEKLKENEFVRSVHDDFKNSRSVEMVKNAVGSAVNSASTGIKTRKNTNILKIVIPVVVVLIIILAVVCNIHTCEECGKTYLGKDYTISFWGESESVCKDCYNDFYMW